MADPLDLVHLQTLVAIADTGGFRRAADALHLSQPTVSQHVRLLERRLKRTLVEKDGRGSRFTVDGERFVVEARALKIGRTAAFLEAHVLAKDGELLATASSSALVLRKG